MSGLVHWTADTWFSETMPVLGRRFLRPFRVHHLNPDDFLRRDFIDCNGDVAMLTTPVMAVALLMPVTTDAGGGGVPGAGDVFRDIASHESGPSVGSYAGPPPPIRLAATPGIILSGEDHARHHQEPYVANYCIATGWCNRWLSAVNFFPACERLVTQLFGLEPRADEQHVSRAVMTSSSSRAFGSGWLSGVVSVAFGVIGLGAVFCFHFPSLLTVPELRALYPVPFIRALLHLVLVWSFVAGVISVCLRRRKILGMTGIGLTLVAALLGGSRVPSTASSRAGRFSASTGFVLNLIAYSAVFIPLERIFARLPEQDVFRQRLAHRSRRTSS